MTKTYTTVQGDKWDSIAYKEMGSTNHTDKLINANLRYKDYYIFPAGIVLDIPEVSKRNYDGMPPWKRVSG